MATRTRTKAETPTETVEAPVTDGGTITLPVETPEAPATDGFDFTSLAPTVAPAPVRASGAGRNAEDLSLFIGWLVNSWEERKVGEKMGVGYAVRVPNAQVAALKGKLNRAAKQMHTKVDEADIPKDGFGVAFAENKVDDTHTALTYATKERKKFAPRKPKNAPAEVPAENTDNAENTEVPAEAVAE